MTEDDKEDFKTILAIIILAVTVFVQGLRIDRLDSHLKDLKDQMGKIERVQGGK